MATLTELLKNSLVAKEQQDSDILKKLNPLGSLPRQPQQKPFPFQRTAQDFIQPQVTTPRGPSLGEFALENQREPAVTGAVTSDLGALSKFSPAEQQAIQADADRSGLKSFDVEFQTPRVGGVRRAAATQPATRQVAAQAPAALAEPTANIAAYMARTGITETPRAPLEITDATGRRIGGAALPSEDLAPLTFDERQAATPVTAYSASPAGQELYDKRTAAFQAYLASPEGQADQVRQAATPNIVEVVRGDKTTFETFTPGATAPALRNYLFGEQQTQQLQRDYLSAVEKPVGAQLSLGEAEALKVADRAMQERGDVTVAGIQAGAQIKGAEISAAGGKNPLYEAAVQDINATTDPAARAAKLQSYLGKASSTAADPNVKIFADQLYDPKEQQAFAALIAAGTPAARAFALSKGGSK